MLVYEQRVDERAIVIGYQRDEVFNWIPQVCTERLEQADGWWFMSVHDLWGIVRHCESSDCKSHNRSLIERCQSLGRLTPFNNAYRHGEESDRILPKEHVPSTLFLPNCLRHWKRSCLLVHLAYQHPVYLNSLDSFKSELGKSKNICSFSLCNWIRRPGSGLSQVSVGTIRTGDSPGGSIGEFHRISLNFLWIFHWISIRFHWIPCISFPSTLWIPHGARERYGSVHSSSGVQLISNRVFVQEP